LVVARGTAMAEVTTAKSFGILHFHGWFRAGLA